MLRRGPSVPRISRLTFALRAVRPRFLVCRFRRWTGFFRDVFCRLHCRRIGIGGGNPFCPAVLGLRAAVGAADSPYDARTFAAGSGAFDPASISPQGGGEPLYRWRWTVKGAPSRRLRSGLVLPALLALLAIVTFIGLGTWQVQRKAWKEALIESLEQRLSAAPVDLSPRNRWAKLDPAKDEFRHVKFSAAFVPGADALVYSTGSALLSDVSVPGYCVCPPSQLAAGGVGLVNRGFLPGGRQDPAPRAVATAAGPADLVRGIPWPHS